MTDSPWLVVGLGNPGSEYKNTRHNVGAMVIDQVVSDLGEKLTHNKKVTSDVCETRLGTKRVVLATLRCYMNESGGPTSSLMNFYKIPVENMIVMHDELDLPFGEIRIKQGGGDNGHNGLKSMTSSFNGPDYYRVRLGIGRPMGQQDPADFVLKAFSKVEQKDLAEFIVRGADVVESLITKGLEVTQSAFNS